MAKKSGGMSSKLKKLGKNWKDARKRSAEGGDGFEFPLEDGNYEFRVTGAEMTETQSGKPQVHWQFKCTEGEDKGTECNDWDQLQSEDNLYWLMRKIARLGFEPPDKVEALPEVLEEIVEAGPTFRGRVKTKDDFTHVWVNKLVAGDDEGEPEEEEKDEKEDDDDDDGVEPEEEAKSGEKDDDDDDDVEIEVGMEVVVEDEDGDEYAATVVKIIDDETLRVKDEDGKKHKVDVGSVSLPEEEEEEPEPPKKKGRKGKRVK